MAPKRETNELTGGVETDVPVTNVPVDNRSGGDYGTPGVVVGLERDPALRDEATQYQGDEAQKAATSKGSGVTPGNADQAGSRSPSSSSRSSGRSSRS